MKPIHVLRRAATIVASGLNTGDFYVAPTATGTGDGLSAANAMSWASHAAQSAATLSGKTVVVMPGTFSLKTIGINGNAATVTYIPRDPADPPVFDQLTLDACSKLKLQQLKIVSSAWSSTAANTNPAILIKNACGDIALDRNTIRSGYRGDPAANIDTTIELPEYACIAAVMSGGAVTSLVIKHAHVGDLMADGTYPLVMHETGGTGFSATFTVASGEITGTTLTNGGSGYSMSLHEASRLTWTGQHRLVDYLPQGWGYFDGSSSVANFTATGNVVSDASEGFKSASPTTSIIATGNQLARVYGCFISFGLSGSNAPPTTTTINDNSGLQVGFYDGYDAGNPHGDVIHLYMNDFSAPFTPSDWKAVQIERNIFLGGGARGGDIGILMGDCPDGIVFDAPRIVGNLFALDVSGSAMNFDGLRDAYIYRNSMIRYDATNPNNASAFSINVPSPSLADNALGKSYVAKNISEVITLNNSVTVKGTGNVSLGQNGATIAYASAFANPTGARNTSATALTAYAPSATYVGTGAAGSDGYLDYTNRTTNQALEPTFVNFDPLSNQTTSTAVNSAWCRVIGGTGTLNWSVTNGTAQVADDSSGTGATSAATSGAVTPGKWMRVNQTTASTGSTATTSTLTINGYAYDFETITQSVASFTTVDNQTTAYSRMGTFGADTGIRKILIACRFKNDAIVAGNVFSDNISNSLKLYLPTTAAYRFWCISGGVASHRSTLAPTTGWETHLFAVDFTQTDPALVSRWNCNGVDVPQATGSTIDTTGTRTVSASQFASSLWAVMGKTDGTALMDGQFAFFWMHWGDATFSLPDIGDAAVQAKFTADQINLTDGSGPLGVQPKVFFNGNAASWNAGLANKGSLSLTLTKQAGTYA